MGMFEVEGVGVATLSLGRCFGGAVMDTPSNGEALNPGGSVWFGVRNLVRDLSVRILRRDGGDIEPMESSLEYAYEK